jgi:hypothetical protein
MTQDIAPWAPNRVPLIGTPSATKPQIKHNGIQMPRITSLKTIHFGTTYVQIGH